jgi:dissimilatory sulfite reductase (desulfoviridin) alpha/beta subunit
VKKLQVHVRLKKSKYEKQILRYLDQIREGIAILMASQEEFDTVLQRIDSATTNIAGDLTALRDLVATMGLNAEQETAIVTALSAAADKLEGIAADPEQPVPEEPVV